MKVCSTHMAIQAEGQAEGFERGLREGACRQLRKLLLRFGRQRLGQPTESQLALLDSLAEGLAQEVLENLLQKLPDAPDWTTLLEGVTPPPPPPPQPEYLKHLDPDPSPDNPGIDEAMEVRDVLLRKSIVHFRLQSMYQDNIGKVMWKKNHELTKHYKLETRSVLVLLCDKADGPAMTGKYRPPALGGKPAGPFFYDIRRVWQETPEEVSKAGIAGVLMMPLSKITPDQLPAIIEHIKDRLRVFPREEQANLWMSACFWMGLRYPADMVMDLLRDVRPLMRESKFHQGTQAHGYATGSSQGLVEGPLRATRWLILTWGSRRLGTPSEQHRTALDAESRLDVLERILEAMPGTSDWTGALAPVGR